MGVFVSYLPVVGVSVALPVIQQALDAPTTGLQWITDAFILPTAALLLTCGVIGDLFGRKKMYLIGLTLSCLGCLVALTGHSVVQVCVGQALTGVGTAALLPATLGLISHVCPDHRGRGTAIALWTAALGLGLTLGPLFNGLIVEHASWRWIFLPTLAIGAVTVLTGAFVLTDSRSDRERHLDIPGQLLASSRSIRGRLRRHRGRRRPGLGLRRGRDRVRRGGARPAGLRRGRTAVPVTDVGHATVQVPGVLRGRARHGAHAVRAGRSGLLAQ